MRRGERKGNFLNTILGEVVETAKKEAASYLAQIEVRSDNGDITPDQYYKAFSAAFFSACSIGNLDLFEKRWNESSEVVQQRVIRELEENGIGAFNGSLEFAVKFGKVEALNKFLGLVSDVSRANIVRELVLSEAFASAIAQNHIGMAKTLLGYVVAGDDTPLVEYVKVEGEKTYLPRSMRKLLQDPEFWRDVYAIAALMNKGVKENHLEILNGLKQRKGEKFTFYFGPNIESVQSALDSSELNFEEVLKYVKPHSHSSPTMSSSVSSSETVAPLTSQSQPSVTSTTMSSSATPEQVPAPLVETTPAALSQQDRQ